MSNTVLPTTLSSNWESQELTHMPFLSRNGRKFTLLFARSPMMGRRAPQYSRAGKKRIWRLAWTACNPKIGSYSEVKSLHTGLGRNELECSPCLSYQDGTAHVSFVGSTNHGTGEMKYHLYRMSGPSLDELAPADRVNSEECYCGFWRPDLTAMANYNSNIVHLKGAVNLRLDTDFGVLARISFDSESPERILITGAIAGDPRRFRGRPFPHTIVYDINERRVLGEILHSGNNVYKPSMCGNLLATARPGPDKASESLKVVFSQDFSIAPTTIQVRAI